mgnify:CR=1 FL=1
MAAIRALTNVIQRSEAQTMMGLEKDLLDASRALQKSNETSIALRAACELFMRYVTRTSTLDSDNLQGVRAHLIDRGNKFAEISSNARATITQLGGRFIRDGTTVLIHGISRVVIALLQHALILHFHGALDARKHMHTAHHTHITHLHACGKCGKPHHRHLTTRFFTPPLACCATATALRTATRPALASPRCGRVCCAAACRVVPVVVPLSCCACASLLALAVRLLHASARVRAALGPCCCFLLRHAARLRLRACILRRRAGR